MDERKNLQRDNGNTELPEPPKCEDGGGKTMNAKQFKRCLDDLLRTFGGYERAEGSLPPGPDGRHHLDVSREDFVALLTSLRWSMQNIADFDRTEELNNDSSIANKHGDDLTPTVK